MIIPIFIHVNSSGGRYIRNKLQEKYYNEFIVHHINPRLYNKNIDKDNIIRFWKYNTREIYNNTNNIFHIKDGIPFCIIRNPVERYKSENFENIEESLKEKKSYNIICKSLLVALSRNVEDYFDDFDENKYNIIKNFLDKRPAEKFIHLIKLDEIDRLETFFEFSSSLFYKEKKTTNNELNKLIEEKNKYDMRLYNEY